MENPMNTSTRSHSRAPFATILHCASAFIFLAGFRCQPTKTKPPKPEPPIVSSIPGENPAARDMDLYYVGLNHHGPDAAGGTREEDLQNLAAFIHAASPDPRRIVIAATGTNPRPFRYPDLNTCPAHRLQHILEELYSSEFSSRGDVVCVAGSEYRVIMGANWTAVGWQHVQFQMGGEPDSYLQTSLVHRSGRHAQLFTVRFATGPSGAPFRPIQSKRLVKMARASLVPTLIAGDFNMGYQDQEAVHLREHVDWLSRDLAAAPQMLFEGNEEIEHIVAIPSDSHEQLQLVGVVHTRADGYTPVPEISHEVIAMRFSLRSSQSRR